MTKERAASPRGFSPWVRRSIILAVYAHMDRGGEELFFESNGDYVTGYVKIPVIGNVCKTEEDINEIVQKTMDFVLGHDVMS